MGSLQGKPAAATPKDVRRRLRREEARLRERTAWQAEMEERYGRRVTARCRRGHTRTHENTRVESAAGKLRCVTCQTEWDRTSTGAMAADEAAAVAAEREARAALRELREWRARQARAGLAG